MTFITNIMDVIALRVAVPCCKLDNEDKEARIMVRETKDHFKVDILFLLVKEPFR